MKLLKMWEEGSKVVDSRQSTTELTTDHRKPAADKENSSMETNDGQWTVDGDQFAIEWFENRLNEVRNQVETLMKQFRLSEALKTIYSLIWDDYCSWFLEWIKPEYGKTIDQNVYEKAVSFFDDLLQILHPFMPFITEEIYHLLKERKADLMVKQFAPINQTDGEILALGDKLKNTISAIRDAKNKNNLKPKEPVSLFIETKEEPSFQKIKEILAKQTNADHIFFNEAPESSAIMTVAGNDKIYIKSGATIDTSVQKEKLTKDLDYLKGFLIAVEKKLSNDKFVRNAKPEVIELERKKKADAESKIKVIEQTIASL